MSLGISQSPGWFPVAVQALVVLAETEGSCPSSMMAQGLKAHAVFVRRVLSQLVRAQIVQAREGRDGGYRLARSPETITLAEVYKAIKSTDTTENAACTNDITHTIQSVLDEIEAEAEQRLLELLSHHTLASIINRITLPLSET